MMAWVPPSLIVTVHWSNEITTNRRSHPFLKSVSHMYCELLDCGIVWKWVIKWMTNNVQGSRQNSRHTGHKYSV